MMLLWIRRIFSTRSAVYVSANWLDKDCIQLERMLEKKRLVYKPGVFAHPILCISSGFSTAGLFANRFLPKISRQIGLWTGFRHPARSPAGKQGGLARRQCLQGSQWQASSHPVQAASMPTRLLNARQGDQADVVFKLLLLAASFPSSVSTAHSRLSAKQFTSRIFDSACPSAWRFRLFPALCVPHLFNK